MRQSLAWIAASVLLGSIGQVLLKVVARQLDEKAIGAIPFSTTLIRIAEAPATWLAIVLFVVSMLIWIRALVTAPLGLAYPLVSVGYVLVIVMSWLFFREPVTIRQAIGMVAIGTGVFLVAGARP